MRLNEIHIHNYKSLRHISMIPSPLTVLVGPNAAGKTNFCDALDFLSEVYRLGLEVAVARKGGYENICYRRMRRSKASISFSIKFEMRRDEWHWPLFGRVLKERNTIFEHTFEIKAESQNINAPFFVDSEEINVRLNPRDDEQLRSPSPGDDEAQLNLLSCSRRGTSITKLSFRRDASRALEERFKRYVQGIKEYTILETELALNFLDRIFLGTSPFQRTIGSLRVFQLNPRNCRESGVPTPNPELDRFGSNLPAVVEYLKSNHADRYSLLLNTVRRVMPTLSELETQYTHRKTLGLIVTEEGFGRPWAAEDVSDGTIQTIALLVAAFDPRTYIVVIEEPENSVHPWAIRNFIEAAREASKDKQVILTTHSPILIDQLKPDELWVARRPKTETLLDPVLELDPSLENAWGEGYFTLSEYLDSGALPEAVPSD